MNSPQPHYEATEAGRRSYDKLESDYMALSAQLATVLAELTALRTDMKIEIAAVRSENAELLGIWKTAKGVNSFIIWLSKFIIGVGIVAAFFKWGPLK